jgi:hypothetical protein
MGHICGISPAKAGGMLQREAQTWPHSPAPRAVFVGISLLAGVSTGAILLHRPTVIHVEQAPILVPVMHAVTAAPPALAKPTLSDFGFVFRTGDQSYLALAEVEAEAVPAHGPIAIFTPESWSAQAVANVQPADVPAAYRRWEGREVVVEGGCRARVEGFAVVARLTGDVSYSATEEKSWTATSTWDQGQKVLAARLDGCHGGYAALAPVIEGVPVDDGGSVALALAAFADSKLVAEAQREYAAAGAEGELLDSEGVVTKQAVRHPVTGELWVSIYAHYSEGCGGPQIDLWAVYRVDATGAPRLARMQKLENTSRLERLLDVDGDGTFEAITRDWLGQGVELRDPSGKVVQKLGLPFYGCPC